MRFIKRSVSVRFLQLILVATVFIIFTAISSDADTLNVREISPDGTIQYVIDIANEGDTIFLPEGTYKELVNVNKSLILKGEGKDKTRLDFIRDEKKEEEDAPCGIKIEGENVTLTIEKMHLHSIKNLNAINLNKDSQTNAILHINDCLFTSDEDSVPSIYAQKAVVTITDSVFKSIKSSGIRVEDGCNLSVENVKFDEGEGNHSSIYVEKSIASIVECIFTNVRGMCITVVGNNSYSELKGCRFSGSGSKQYPSVWVKNKAEAVATDCTFKDGNGSSIMIENKGSLKLEGKNEFSGNVNMKEPIIKIINGEATIGGTNLKDKSIFSNIEMNGILMDGGKLFANNCQFQGDAENVTFIDCKKGTLIVKRCDFGDNKKCIVVEDGKSVHVENCNFKKSQSHSIQIKKVTAKNKSLILECAFSGANDSCIKVEEKSKLFIRLCRFKGGNMKKPCIDVYDSHVAFIRCFFKDISAVGIKGVRGSDITVKGCEFSSLSDGEDYAIHIEDKSKANIANCVFDWANNKLFFAKDCKELKFEGISSEYKKLRKKT